MIGYQLNLSSSVQKPYKYTMARALSEPSQLSRAKKKIKRKKEINKIQGKEHKEEKRIGLCEDYSLPK